MAAYIYCIHSPVAAYIYCIHSPVAAYIYCIHSPVAAYIYYCTVRYSILARINLCTNPPKRGK